MNSVSLEECCFEGSALKELIRQLAKSLMEKGTFDETCEFMLRDYRCQREESRCRAATFPQDKKRAYFIRRSTFNGGDSEVLNTPKSGTSNGPKKQPNSSNSSSSSGSKSSESELIKTEQQPVRGGVPRRLLLRRSPATIRGVSVRERKAIAKMGDSLFAELGEVLLSEFHSVVYAHPQAFDVHEREMKILVG
jgi:hypothetical protein